MTVTDLVYFKNQLDLLSVSAIQQPAISSLNEFLYVMKNNSYSDIDLIENRHLNVIESFTNFDKEIANVKAKLQQDIERLEKTLFQQSYSTYHDESIYDK